MYLIFFILFFIFSLISIFKNYVIGLKILTIKHPQLLKKSIRGQVPDGLIFQLAPFLLHQNSVVNVASSLLDDHIRYIVNNSGCRAI